MTPFAALPLTPPLPPPSHLPIKAGAAYAAPIYMFSGIVERTYTGCPCAQDMFKWL